MGYRSASPSSRRMAGPVVAAAALGVWMLAWGWAAEAHEPSRVGPAPGALAVSVLGIPAVSAFATPAAGIGVSASVTAPAEPTPVVLAADPVGVVRRPWTRGMPPEPVPVPAALVPVRPREPYGWFTMRGGFFDSDGVADDDFVLGFKLTGRVGDGLHLGFSTDWQYHEQTYVERVDQYPGPGGAPVEVVVTSYETDSHLIPMMAVAELRPRFGPVQPFIGSGLGYEVLIVETRDYLMGYEYQDEFGGFGWQPYGGVAFTFGRAFQLVTELYGNLSTVERTVRDYDTGYLVEQNIDVDGIGFRAGLAFGF